jgi:Cytochrome C oxidase, cbb3-type, subunit III
MNEHRCTPIRRPLALLAPVLLLSLAPAAGAAEAGLDAAAAAKGKVVFRRYCASCHGQAGKGDGPIAADLRVSPTDLTRLSERSGGHFPFDRVTRLVDGRDTARGHGTPDMPVWGDAFQRTEGTEAPSVRIAIEQIAHYLWSVQHPSP